ncbi:MAG TPA: helix-turn-helix transcriptional regulator, partial [Ignavibacteriaceae bacterium]|nr:helix-turn-helix transcriptional regulator [Ignavibacteriaceae bacterium]
MFDKLAEELKAARIKNNFTLKQLSSRTRIDIKFLEAIEEGNFSFLPEIYVKAFIKEYAVVVGIDGDIILKKYEAAKDGLPYEDMPEEKLTIENKSIEPVEEKPRLESGVEKTKKEEMRQPVNPPEHSQTPVFDSTVHPQTNLKTSNKNTLLIGV